MTQKIIELSDVEKQNLAKALFSGGGVQVRISNKNALTLQRAWDKYGAYKKAYHNGERKKGHGLSFLWMLQSIKTSLFNEKLEVVAAIYYRYWAQLNPVEFVNEGNNSQLVIFSLRNQRSIGPDLIEKED